MADSRGNGFAPYAQTSAANRVDRDSALVKHKSNIIPANAPRQKLLAQIAEHEAWNKQFDAHPDEDHEPILHTAGYHPANGPQQQPQQQQQQQPGTHMHNVDQRAPAVSSQQTSRDRDLGAIPCLYRGLGCPIEFKLKDFTKYHYLKHLTHEPKRTRSITAHSEKVACPLSTCKKMIPDTGLQARKEFWDSHADCVATWARQIRSQRRAALQDPVHAQ